MVWLSFSAPTAAIKAVEAVKAEILSTCFLELHQAASAPGFGSRLRRVARSTTRSQDAFRKRASLRALGADTVSGFSEWSQVILDTF